MLGPVRTCKPCGVFIRLDCMGPPSRLHVRVSSKLESAEGRQQVVRMPVSIGTKVGEQVSRKVSRPRG